MNYLLIGILLLCAFLRVNVDTFISGCNFDEFAIISIAKLDIFQMLKAIAIEDYHAPLYYFVVHMFSRFENNLILLRLLNIAFSVINTYIFYKIGKLLISKKAGYILAFIFAVNHLQISVANFIKFYALSILLTSISIYYFIKFLKGSNVSNKLAIINIFLILSHTFGFVFVFFEYLILLLNKAKIRKIAQVSSIGFFLFLPILIIQTKNALLDSIISPHGDYPSWSLFAIYNFLNDYFSPLVNYSCNVETIEGASLILKASKSFFENGFFDYISFVSFILLSFISVMICVFGLFKAREIKICKKILLLGFLYFAFFNLIVVFEVTGFIPLYSFSSGIIFLICSTLGLFTIKSKIKYFLIGYIVISQLVVTNAYPLEKREVPYKIFANIDKHIEKIDNKIPIILIDAARFAKYYYKEKKIFAIDYEELFGSHSKKWIRLAFGEEIAKNISKKNIKNIVSPCIFEDKINSQLSKYLNDELFSKISKGEKLILVFGSNNKQFILSDSEIKDDLSKLYSYKLINSAFLYQLNNNDEKVLNQSEIGEIIHSFIVKHVVREIEKSFILSKIEQFAPVPLKDYQKIKEFHYPSPSVIEYMTMPLQGWIFVTYEKK